MKISDTFKVTAAGDHEIVMIRDFAAAPGLVFAALTDPLLVRRWLLGPPGWTMPVCEIDLRIGGAWRYVWRSEEKKREFSTHGEYREIVKPTRTVHTEIFEEGSSLVTSSLTSKGDSTTLTMTQHFPTKEARDGALESGMTDGVAASYDLLDEILALEIKAVG